MPNSHGDFIWYELITSDPDAAQAFYSTVVGWTFSRPFGGLNREYRVFSAPDADIGGLMKMPEGMQAGPIWLGYVGVDDVDAASARIKDLGGAVHVPPTDIPEVGRFAFVADPQGVLFYLMRGTSQESSTAFHATATGHCAWNELVTSDQEAALAFYSEMFGWKKGDAMPMGELGDYRFIHQGELRIGAVMNSPPDYPRPMWNHYFRVDGIDAAAARIRENGGTIIFGPMEVPGGDWVVNGIDPQGGLFSLVGSKT